AQAHYGQALKLRREIGDRAEEASTLINLGLVKAHQGRLRETLEDQRQALALKREIGDRWGEGVALTQLGRTALALGKPEQALARLEGLRTRIGDPDLLASFSDLKHRAYDLHLDLLMEAHRADPGTGFDRAGLESSERARARTLVELLGAAGVEAGPGVDPAL